MAKETADLIRQLSKKFLESGDENDPDELKNAFSDAVHVAVCERRFIERHKKAILEVHFHVFVPAAKLTHYTIVA